MRNIKEHDLNQCQSTVSSVSQEEVENDDDLADSETEELEKNSTNHLHQ